MIAASVRICWVVTKWIAYSTLSLSLSRRSPRSNQDQNGENSEATVVCAIYFVMTQQILADAAITLLSNDKDSSNLLLLSSTNPCSPRGNERERPGDGKVKRNYQERRHRVGGRRGGNTFVLIRRRGGYSKDASTNGPAVKLSLPLPDKT